MKNNKFIGLILAILIFSLTACKTKQDAKVIIFNNDISNNNNGINRNFYLSAKKQPELQEVVFNNTNFTNRLRLLDSIIYYYSNLKVSYLIMNINEFVKEIKQLLDRLISISSSPTKFITIDQEVNIDKTKLLNFIEIKFNLIKMGFDLGYQVGNYFMVKNPSDKSYNFSITSYVDEDLSSRLLRFGFLEGLNKIGNNKFKFLNWSTKLNKDQINNKQIKQLVVDITTKLIKEDNVAFIFNPNFSFNDDILKAFINVNNNVKSSLVTIDVINENFSYINNHQYLLATASRCFSSVINKLASYTTTDKKLINDWRLEFYHNYNFKGVIDYNHNYFDDINFNWELEKFKENELKLINAFTTSSKRIKTLWNL